MSYIKRKRSFHPVLAVLYVLLYAGITGFAFYNTEYNTSLQYSFLLSPIFSKGIHIPVFISVIVLVGALFVSGYFMREVLINRFEISRKLNLYFFVIPLLILPSQSIVDMTLMALFTALAALTISYVLSAEAGHSEIKKIFFSGFMAGILFLFSGATALFLLIFPLLLFANRIFKVRFVLIYGFAFVLPLGYFLTYLYLTDFDQWELFFLGNNFKVISYEHIFEFVNVYVLVFLFLLMLIVVARVHFKLSEYKIAIRRAYYSILFVILVLILGLVFMPEMYLLTYVSALLFISLFYYMRLVTDVKRKIMAIVIYLIPILIFALNYYFISALL